MKIKCKVCNSKLNMKKFKGCQVANCPIIPMAAEKKIEVKMLMFTDFKTDVVKKPGLVEQWETKEEPPVANDYTEYMCF